MSIISKDYTVTLEDKGQLIEVTINADSINEAVASGISLSEAINDVEQDAFQRAIYRGLMTENAIIVASERD
jgi:hypothetical protein